MKPAKQSSSMYVESLENSKNTDEENRIII